MSTAAWIAVGFAGLSVFFIALLARAIGNAPVGYEDPAGFHYGPEPIDNHSTLRSAGGER